MAAPENSPVIPPPFEFALSGEFYIPQIPDIAQTVGRLALATYQVGERSRPAHFFTLFTFIPEWAPDIRIETAYVRGNHLSAIALARNDGKPYPVFSHSTDPSQVHILYQDITLSQSFPLGSAAQQDEAKAAVAAAAQAFFEAAPSP